MLKHREISTLAILLVIVSACMGILAACSYYKKERFVNSINDVELSIFEDIPQNILMRTNLSISLDEQDLNIFKTNKESVEEEVEEEEVEEEAIESPELIDGSMGYFVDSDLPFIERLSKLYEIKFSPYKVSNIKDINNHSLLFMRSSVDDNLFQDLSSEYELLELDKNRRMYLNYYLPFSKLKTTVDNTSKRIINIVKIPKIILNARTIAVNAEASKTLNIHYGKRNFMQPRKFGKMPQLKIDKQNLKNVHECVNTEDSTTIGEYKTKASCESPYDIFGEPKTEKMKWLKRCDDELECKYYSKEKNSRRGLCKDGTCEKPLMNKSIPLHYGTDKEDYVFEDDLQDRLSLNLRPILNL